MCETCEFQAVNCFEDALNFMKKFLVIRILHLYRLYNTDKFQAFVKAYDLPKTTFQEIILDFTTALTVILNYESCKYDADAFMRELQRLNIQHVLFGLEEHFPESVRKWAKQQKEAYRDKQESDMEKYCNHLYCIDRFM